MVGSSPVTAQHDLQRVYLLDCSSHLERRILQAWIRSTPTEGAADAALIVNLCRPGDSESEMLQTLLASGKDYYLVPLRTLWLRSDETQTRTGLRRLLLGDARTPGRLRQHLIHRRTPGRVRPLVAEGASLSELRARLAEQNSALPNDTQALMLFIHRQAVLALERAERNVRGARYKVPRLLEEEVLSKPRLVKTLAEEAERYGQPLQMFMREARKCLRELAPVISPTALDMMAALGRYLYTRGFDRQIDVLEQDLARVRKLGKRHPIAFLMTHKSHIDGFLLVTMFYDLNMPPVHLFGGINMSFLGLGALGKRSGAIFIRRSMGDDNVYKAVFKQYIDYLAEKRFPLLWALEGTRSRSGKLMPPRYGLINYVVDSYVRTASTDMILMPVSIAYDQVPEVGDYIAEHKGISKRPESASWFMQYVSGLRNPFGKIHVRFGQGVKLSEVLGEPRPDLQVSPLDIQKIAFRLSVDANNVTPVLATGMIAFVLSAAGRKAMSLGELAHELRIMARLIKTLGLPSTADVEMASAEALDRTLQQLVHTGVLVRYEGAHEPLFAIAAEAAMAAAYYRNGMIHFLVNGAIAELALLAVAEQPGDNAHATFHAEALHIRDVLKFEFFFQEKALFLQELEQHLDLRAPLWRTALEGGSQAIYFALWELRPLLAVGTLRPFLESYLIVAETLLHQDAAADPADSKLLLRECMSLGRERVLQQRIASEESAAKLYLENGLQLARSRGLLKPASENARQEFMKELRTLVRRTAFVATLAENRRLGIDAPALDLAV